jgi:NAD(P)H dehydrogenase (quinone)
MELLSQPRGQASATAIVNLSQNSAWRESPSHAVQDHWVPERVLDWSRVASTHLRLIFFAEWLFYPRFAKEI